MFKGNILQNEPMSADLLLNRKVYNSFKEFSSQSHYAVSQDLPCPYSVPLGRSVVVMYNSRFPNPALQSGVLGILLLWTKDKPQLNPTKLITVSQSVIVTVYQINSCPNLLTHVHIANINVDFGTKRPQQVAKDRANDWYCLDTTCVTN